MNKKVLFIVFTIIIMSPFSVKALSCDYNEQARLRKISTNVVPSYTYIENDDSVVFTVTLTNINSDLYVVDSTTGIRYDYNGNSEISIGGYNPGTNIRYTIYTTKDDCMDSYLTIKYVNLPSYNKYYKDPLCSGYENLSICSKWQPVNYTYDQFVSRINQYKNASSENENDNDVDSADDTIFDLIFNFIINYYLYIIGVSLVIVFIITYIKNKRNNLVGF